MTATAAADLLEALSAASLDPRGFSHAQHIIAAREALRTHEFFDAVRVVADGLRALARRHGVPDKYNATLTFAFMSLIAERTAAQPGLDDMAFIGANPDLCNRSVFAALYSEARLASPVARKVALLPDRGPVPADS